MTNNMFSILKNSITFQMSLGSKELFHSNFLQWLSIVDWDCFLSLLHSLTGEKVLWWEKQNCCVEAIPGKGKRFHPDNGNIEVRREYNHYDLSIYILVGFTKPSRGGVQKKKWRPVFILENKVKCIPYQEQLDGYANNFFDEWDKSFPAKRPKDWNTQKVAAVLLTLFDGIAITQSPIGNDIFLNWNINNYKKLSESIKDAYNKSKMVKEKEKVIIDDYCTFTETIHNLLETEDWKVEEKDKYADRILNGGDIERKWRISDLREKVHHERMLKLLECKLTQTFPGKCEHWNKEKEFKNPKEKKHYNTGIVFYETAFSRGIGAIQAFIIINDAYRLMIQLQGKQYRKCLILHNDNPKRIKSICKRLKDKIWQDFEPQNKFGDRFKYQYELIDENETIGNVLDKVVVDLGKVLNKIEELKRIK